MIVLENNYLIPDSKIQIGDSVEKLYSIFGHLEYNLGDDSDTVSYCVYRRVSADTSCEYSVSFRITDRAISSIDACFEEFKLGAYSETGSDDE